MLSLHPTLAELCGLSSTEDLALDGVSLLPLLRNPMAVWARPAITTWGRNNHAARVQRYRYVRHPNGDEQLYAYQSDPDEFTNLTDKAELDAVKKRFGKWISKTNAIPVSNK